MVLDNKNVISVLRKMVGTTKQAGTNKPASANKELNHAEKIETADCKQDGAVQRSVKIAIDVDDCAQDICEQGTELLPRSESARQKRKRAVSECASIIADPTQVKELSLSQTQIFSSLYIFIFQTYMVKFFSIPFVIGFNRI